MIVARLIKNLAMQLSLDETSEFLKILRQLHCVASAFTISRRLLDYAILIKRNNRSGSSKKCNKDGALVKRRSLITKSRSLLATAKRVRKVWRRVSRSTWNSRANREPRVGTDSVKHRSSVNTGRCPREAIDCFARPLINQSRTERQGGKGSSRIRWRRDLSFPLEILRASESSLEGTLRTIGRLIYPKFRACH